MDNLRQFRRVSENCADRGQLTKHASKEEVSEKVAVIGIGKTREELERRFSDRPGVYIELISPAKLVWLL